MLRRWLPAILWAGVILVLTSIPGAYLPTVHIDGLDKLVHLSVYGILAYLAFPAVAEGSGPKRAVIFVLIAISIFGALDEWHQQFIPGRTMDVADWTADTLGAFFGLMAALVRRRRSVAT